MPAFDDYQPEELEATTRQLTAQLEYIYQQPAAIAGIQPDEQEEILTRARARLLISYSALAGTDQEQRPALVLVNAPAESLPLAQPIRPRSKRLMHRLNALAAILVVFLLSAGFALMFTHHPTTTGGPPAPPQSSSALPCFLAHPDDPGLLSVCQQHLYQDMHIMSVDHQFRATLTRAYADANRVVLSLRFETLINGRYTANRDSFNSTFYAGLRVSLQTAQGQVLYGQGSSGEESATDNAWVVIFAMPEMLTLPSELHLHLLAQTAVDSVTPAAQPPFFNVKLTLDFTLPLRPELRTISIEQTRIVNGLPMTLQKLRISPSATVVVLTYKSNALIQVWQGVALTLGNATCANKLNTSYFADPQGLKGPLSAELNCPLYQAHGPGKLVFKDFTSGKLFGTFSFEAP